MHTSIYPFLTRQGAGRFKLNKAALEKLPILLPSLPEQQKIAEILSTWDEAIDLTQQLIEAKQRRKKGLMEQLLTGKVQFPEFPNSKQQKDSVYGLIPEDWNLAKLGEIIEQVSRPHSIEPYKQYNLLGVRWYCEGAHIHDVVLGTQIQTSTLTEIWEHDILYNKMWTTKGAFAIAKKKHHLSYGSTEYPQFRAKEKQLDITFFEYIYHHPRFLYEAIIRCTVCVNKSETQKTNELGKL